MRGASRTRLSVILAFAGAVCLARVAAAQECPATCGLEKRACVHDARAQKLACKMDCRNGAGRRAALGACARDCMATFRSDRQGCDTDHTSCLGDCNAGTPPAPPMCRMMCAHDFVDCTQSVVSAARVCVHDCVAGPGRRSCIAACGTAARDGEQACADTASACVDDCGASPSGAFLN